jgi:hypothetical protein
LLEKVWAKLNGNYEITEGGYSHEPLAALLGAPNAFFYAKEKSADDWWTFLAAEDQKQHVMCAGIEG